MLLNISKLKQIYRDLRLTQVNSGEISVFVNNLSPLLINSQKKGVLFKGNKYGASAKFGQFLQFVPIQELFYCHSFLSR